MMGKYTDNGSKNSLMGALKLCSTFKWYFQKFQRQKYWNSNINLSSIKNCFHPSDKENNVEANKINTSTC